LIRSVKGVLGAGKAQAFLFFNPKVHATLWRIRRGSRASHKLIAAPAVVSLNNPERAEHILVRINQAVPCYLQRDHRDDVVSDMTYAWMEGRLRPDDIERRTIEFVRARFKSDHNKYGNLSLDVPIYLDGTATLLDRLSTEVDTGYWDINVMASTGRRK
jgi:hypothetical protein